MGVTTLADEHIITAKRDVNEALLALDQIVIGRCWGHDEFNPAYAAKIQHAFRILMEARELLG